MCYIAIFAGDACSSDGGVYKVSTSWFTDHFGGNLGDLGSCGKVVESWMETSPSHRQFASSLATHTDLELGSLAVVATFIAEFACESAADAPTTSPTKEEFFTTGLGYYKK